MIISTSACKQVFSFQLIQNPRQINGRIKVVQMASQGRNQTLRHLLGGERSHGGRKGPGAIRLRRGEFWQYRAQAHRTPAEFASQIAASRDLAETKTSRELTL